MYSSLSPNRFSTSLNLMSSLMNSSLAPSRATSRVTLSSGRNTGPSTSWSTAQSVALMSRPYRYRSVLSATYVHDRSVISPFQNTPITQGSM